MILLKLFLTFLEIGAFTFGGGYAMIPLVREKCLTNGWLNDDEIMNFIAVSESTPGPIAINMATFVGSSQSGILGSLVATLGVVLPSFVIILVISALFKNLIKYKGVQAALSGIRPIVVGLILGTSITMFLSVICSFTALGDKFKLDIFALIIFALVVLFSFLYKKFKKNAPSPILIIVIGAIFGMLFYS